MASLLSINNEYLGLLILELSVFLTIITQVYFLIKLNEIKYRYRVFTILKFLEIIYVYIYRYEITEISYVSLLIIIETIPVLFYLMSNKKYIKKLLILGIIFYTVLLWNFMFFLSLIILKFIYGG